MAVNGKALLAYWLERPASGSGVAYGYGMRAVRSDDGGENWTPVFSVGMDNTADYSGFGAFQPTEDGFLMAYLDPLKDGKEQGGPGDQYIKTLRLMEVGPTGQVRSDIRLDADVCSCCPLGIAETAAGPVVVYRDHEAGEIRDISIVRLTGGKWTAPRPVHRDGWRIRGCPTNGPAIAADGAFVAVAWFTMANEQPRVRLAFSNDGGATFGPPARVDEGNPLGWADVTLTPGGDAVVSWLERGPKQKGKNRLLLRAIAADGDLGPVVSVADTPSGRAAGMPRMVRYGSDLLLAWKSNNRVRTALVSLEP